MQNLRNRKRKTNCNKTNAKKFRSESASNEEDLSTEPFDDTEHTEFCAWFLQNEKYFAEVEEREQIVSNS